MKIEKLTPEQEHRRGKLIDETFAKQLLSDMDRIIETLKEIQGSGKVEKKEPCHPENHPLSNVYGKTRCEKCGNYYEKKEQRKLADILLSVERPKHESRDWYLNFNRAASEGLAKAAIDAVIECYKDWQVDFSYEKAVLTFPKYLKEKML